ncbi:hypothetical protein V8F20_004213 [Naviculisporaceae sp. PSN 640]
MKYTIASVLLGASLVAAEVPQEHSHNFVLDLTRIALNLNNPKGILDPVFGLLGNAAAADGAGTVTNLDCLQQETADQAFTNAKAIGDIPGMAGALLFRAIERNTLGVGVKSVLCTETAVNPEIAALTQHQDPASDGAAEINKAITLELAKQLALIGADPLLALESGTFAPGDLNDATGRGNSCDTDPNDPGCIFTDRLLVLDASIEEVQAAVADITPTFTGTGPFTGTLGGPAPPVVSGAGDRPFTVNGNTFNNLAAAIVRSCDIQNNACFNAFNSGALDGDTAQCADQLDACKAAGAGLARRQAGGFGSCSNPTIVFKAGLDGRRENSFIPENSGDFNHGSALNIGIIASFICDRLASSCKAPVAVVAACEQARQAAIVAQQNQAAADAFNRILLGLAGAGAAAPPAAVITPAPEAKGKGKAKANGKGKGKVQVLTVTQCS